jgi:uncharacterized protein with GYD domain
VATYFILETVTREAAMTVDEAPVRAARVPAVAARFGVDLIEWHFTLADFDFLMKVEADDEDAVTAFSLALSRSGNVRTQVVRAYSPEGWTQIVGRVTSQASSGTS